MTTIEEKGIIKASREKVWSFMIEHENFPKYILDYIEGQIISENRTGLDSEFEWFTKFWGRTFRSVEKATEWNENHKVSYHGDLAGAEFWSQMLFNDMDGGTELTIIIEYKMPYSIIGWLLDKIYFKRRVRKEIKYAMEQARIQLGT